MDLRHSLPGGRVLYTVLLRTHSLLVDEEDAARVRFCIRDGKTPFLSVNVIHPITRESNPTSLDLSTVSGIVQHHAPATKQRT